MRTVFRTASSIHWSIFLASFFCLASCLMGQTLVVKGSDTLGAKLVPQLKEYYRAHHPEVTFEIAAEGSSTGISAITSKQADIGMSSRPVSQQEQSRARLNGVEIQEIAVAYDGIAIIVNETNPVTTLSHEEIRQIFSGRTRNWAAVAGRPGWISVYTRNTASGTYKDFQELAMAFDDYGSSSQKLAGNEQIASEVAGNPNGIGYVGLPYIHTPGVRVVPINGYLPTKEAIAADNYPYARPTFYLLDANRPNPLAQSFVDFTLSPEGQKVVEDVHFIPAK